MKVIWSNVTVATPSRDLIKSARFVIDYFECLVIYLVCKFYSVSLINKNKLNKNGIGTNSFVQLLIN